MSKYDIGKSRIKDIVGVDADAIIAQFADISPDFANYVVEFAYGDLYAREGLSDKSRELAVIACLIGQKNMGMPLKVHLKAMLNVGWTEKEIIELLIFLVGCIGFPSIVDAIQIAKGVFEEARAKVAA